MDFQFLPITQGNSLFFFNISMSSFSRWIKWREVKKNLKINLVVTSSLNIDGMKTFSVDIVVLIFMRCLEMNVCAMNVVNHPREPSFVREPSFGSCNFFLGCWPLDEISVFVPEHLKLCLQYRIHQTSKGRESPTTCKKLPDAQKYNGARI